MDNNNTNNITSIKNEEKEQIRKKRLERKRKKREERKKQKALMKQKKKKNNKETSTTTTIPSDGKIYKCNHCNLIFPTRNKLFDHIHGRNGSESCLEAIKEGAKQEIQTKRVLMHIGYYSNNNSQFLSVDQLRKLIYTLED